MDFLDPRKKRAYQIRLMIGYALMAVAIALGTVILVYGAYGYGFNAKTGSIIQNGLLFVDSKPGGAQIYLNNNLNSSTTSARLVLPAGTYNLKLKKAGYRDWGRKIILNEHSIGRYVYPFLFPVKPLVGGLKTYSSQPPLFTQSLNQKWLLVQQPDTPAGSVSFDEYDTTNLTQAPQVITIPDNLLTKTDQPSSQVSVVEWSSDNNHVILEHDYSGGSEFILFNRDKPDESINLNKLFNSTDFNEVALYNKKVSQVYLFNQAGGTLSLGDISSGTVDHPLLSHVVAFKPYSTDFITYVTDDKAPVGKANVRIWNNGKTYLLNTVTSGDKYLIDAASYAGHMYFVAGSNKDALINVYKDPLSNIKDPSLGKAIPVLSLNELGATELNFSNNARFIVAENGQQFSVYDIENQDSYAYTLQAELAGPLDWMDGNHMIGASSGQTFVMDFDSTNQQLITATLDSKGGLFSQDYNHLFTLAQADNGVVLESVDMRAGADLPKQ